ncbi:hypothetical protein RHMOL_Rhmol11G0051400 [Rhododendron molle]|uniref:Uncharacterized protein n=1 Tax=Rhododendron molle TaxID=49168 RepID=A0ACC0LP81_RHOML|nr:hypothetical protein RHMOL_Rhmol11G0051400 [Rhododendron molle]
MFTRTVNDEEVEDIIEEEELCRVPIYFYDPYAPTDDYRPVDEVDNLKVEGAKEEESVGNDRLDKVLLNLLFDEGITDDEIRVIHPIMDRFGLFAHGKPTIAMKQKLKLN